MGADINAAPKEDYNGLTALQAAADSGNLKVVRFWWSKVQMSMPLRQKWEA